MGKRNKRRIDPLAGDSIIEEEVMGEVAPEVEMESEPTPVVEEPVVEKEDVEPVPEVQEETPVVSEAQVSEPDHVPVRVEPQVIVKPKYDAEKKNQTGRYRLCIIKEASPLKWINVKNKIKGINFVSFDVDSSTHTIYTRQIGTKSEAITIKKQLQGRGLKPVLENL